MQRPASRSRFEVVRKFFCLNFAASRGAETCPARRFWWSAAMLMLLGLRSGLAAESDNVLLDFTAKWCGPCQQMSSIVSKLERQGLPIRKVDIDQEKELASRFNVQSIPCFVLVANGKELDRVTGLTDERQLRGMLNRLPKSAPNLAQPKGESPGGNGPSKPGLGKSVDLGELGSLDGKRSMSGLPLGKKNKGAEALVADNSFDEQFVPRGQSPDNIVTDPLLASVRLRVQDGTGINFGSGTIIDSKPGRTVILTCGHIFRKAGNDSKVEVDLFGQNAKSRPETVSGQVLHFDLEKDIGVVTISHAQQWPVIRLGAAKELAVKDRVVGIGCGGGDRPTREDLMLTSLNKYDGPDNIECTGMPQQGRSGGGLFLGSEQIGICVAADPKEKRGIYVGMKPIAMLLDKVGMGHLAPLPPAVDGTLAATKTADLNEPSLPDHGSITADDDIARFLGGEASPTGMTGPAAAPQDYEGAEIVCIIRSKKPGVASRVVIVNQASTRFVGDLLHESHGPAECAITQTENATRQPNSRSIPAESNLRAKSGAVNRPFETSFAPEPYRRERDR